MSTSQSTTSLRYTNIALSVIAVLLALLVVERFPASSPLTGSAAMAAPADDPVTDRVNPAEQRKEIISELRSLNARIDKLTGSIKSPMPVKVVELPANFNASRDRDQK